MKITKEQASFLEDFLAYTGFEIWNAGASHRMRSGSGDGVTVSNYALQGDKDYISIQAAINFMIKKDEE